MAGGASKIDVLEVCGSDCCREAVTRVYTSMQSSGASDRDALGAAVRVFRYHHPEVPSGQIRDLVETWVYSGPVH